MTRKYDKNRRPSTIIRDNTVHDTYKEICEELGTLANVVSKSYIYERISKRTGLCVKTIANILNHTSFMEAT